MTWLPQLNATGAGRRGRRRTVRASLVDWRFAGLPVGVVAGPFDLWPGTVLDILNRMSDVGPDYRVCLKPDTDRLRWEVVTPDSSWVLPAALCAADDVEASLARCFAHQPVGAVSVRVADRFVFVRFDHGIGDAHVMMEILAAFTGNSPHLDGFVEPRPRADTRYPVPEAIARSVVADPRHHMMVVRAGLGAALSHLTTAATRAPQSAETKSTSTAHTSTARPAIVATSRGVRSVVVRCSGDFVRELKAVRETIGRDSITIAALVAHRITAAFTAEIPNLSDKAGIVVDLRRNLPPERGTLCNVAAVASVPFDPDPAAFGAAYTAAVNAPTLPARLGVALLKARVAARRAKGRSKAGAEGSATAGATSGPVGLSISDLTRHPSAAKLAWSSQPGEAGHTFGIALPPGGLNSIAVAVTQVGAQINLTATFHDGCVDPDAVRRALESVVTVVPQAVQPPGLL